MTDWEGLQIEGRLGVGATGTVWLARQVALGRLVAVKDLAVELAGDEAARERLRQEAQVLARLDHPNCVAVYNYLESDSRAAIVMEYVEGVSLRSLTERHNLSVEQALLVLEGALSGLAYAHEQGIVHGDVKPENILLATSGQSKLVDFGLAAAVETRRAPGTGSPAYSSPEAASGQPLGAASDLYSAGLVLFELLTGAVPLAPEGARLALNPRSATLSPRVAALIQRTIDRDPAIRPATATAFLDELRAAADADCGRDWRRRAMLVPLIAAAAAGGATATEIAQRSATSSAKSATDRAGAKWSRILYPDAWVAAIAAVAVVAAGVGIGFGGTKLFGGSGPTPAAVHGVSASTAPPGSAGVSVGASATASSDLDGTYTIVLPSEDRGCGFPSLNQETLAINGTTATITPVGGSTPLTGTAKATDSAFTIHITNGITDAPGAIVIGLSGTTQPGGNLSGESTNSGIFPGGTNGFGCNSLFSAVRTSAPPQTPGTGVPAPPAATSGAASCTQAAISAAARALDGANFDGLDGSTQDFGCAGQFAYAFADVGSGSTKADVTILFIATRGTWQAASRSVYCENGSVPQQIYEAACETQ